MKKGEEIRVVATNKKAYRDFEILDRYEAGIELKGSEIKSVRQGSVNLKDGFAKVENGEVWLHNVYIAPYEKEVKAFAPHPLRPRKLLLHKHEIKRLAGQTSRKGFTLVPLKMYIKGKWAKVELALAKGKTKVDKREEIKEREIEREIDRIKKEYI